MTKTLQNTYIQHCWLRNRYKGGVDVQLWTSGGETKLSSLLVLLVNGPFHTFYRPSIINVRHQNRQEATSIWWPSFPRPSWSKMCGSWRQVFQLRIVLEGDKFCHHGSTWSEFIRGLLTEHWKYRRIASLVYRCIFLHQWGTKRIFKPTRFARILSGLNILRILFNCTVWESYTCFCWENTVNRR